MAHLFADDYEWHQRREWPGRDVYRRDELAELRAELEEWYPDFELTPLEFKDIGTCVLVKVRVSARMGAAGERVETKTWQVWRIVDGQAKETRVFTERDEAVAACR